QVDPSFSSYGNEFLIVIQSLGGFSKHAVGLKQALLFARFSTAKPFSFLEGCPSLIGSTLRSIGSCESSVSPCVHGIETPGFLPKRKGLVQLLTGSGQLTKQLERLRIIGVDPARFAHLLLGIGEFALEGQDMAKQPV